MKIIRLVYFHIYNSYYKDGNYENDIPELTASGLVGCSFSIIIFSVIVTIYHTIFDKRMTYEMVVTSMILLILLFFYVFMYKNKYKDIYLEFKGTKLDTTLIKILSWLTPIIAIIMVGLYSYVFNPPK